MKNKSAREILIPMLTAPDGPLSEPARVTLYRNDEARVMVGRGHALPDESAIERFCAKYRQGFEGNTVGAIKAQWTAVKGGAVPDGPAELMLTRPEIERLLDDDLRELEEKIDAWIAGGESRRAPLAARQVVLYLAFKLGIDRFSCLAEITCKRDWKFLDACLHDSLNMEHASNDPASPIHWKSEIRSVMSTLKANAALHLRNLLEELPITAHRALAEEYECITGLSQRGLPSYDIQGRLLNYDADKPTPGLSALCLSGGGIRSASFCLGAIQTLVEKKIFGEFDYLSTVSGGGYIGTALVRWLVALRKDEKNKQLRNADDQSPLTELEKQLETLAKQDYAQMRANGGRLDDEGPLAWLRMHTNYLSRRLSVFSADTWTVISTYLRNLFIVWMIFWPWIALFLFVPWFSVWLGLVHGATRTENVPLGALGVLIGAIGASYLHPGSQRCDEYHRKKSGDPDIPVRLGIPWPSEGDDRVALGAALLLLACYLMSWAFPSPPCEMQCDRDYYAHAMAPLTLAALAIMLVLTQVLLAVVSLWALRKPPVKTAATMLFASLAAAVVQGGLIYAIAVHHFTAIEVAPVYTALRALFLPPAFLAALIVGETVKSALRSTVDSAGLHEHQGRVQAFMVLVLAAWVCSAALTVLLPPWLDLQGSSAQTYAASASAVSLYFTVNFGYRQNTPGRPETRSTRLFTLLGMLGIVLLAVIISIAAWNVIHPVPHDEVISPCTCAGPSIGNIKDAHFEIPASADVCKLPTAQCIDRPTGEYLDAVFTRLDEIDSAHRLFVVCIVLIVSFCVMPVLSRLIRMNEFSLHSFYRDRLVRGFYGGFRGTTEPRKAHLFTGFDDKDDIPLHEVRALYCDPDSDGQKPSASTSQRDGTAKSRKPPFLVVNTALNLVKGTALAWQERKADTFTFTALHAGNYRHGYRPVDAFAGGVRLGTAMAISGAAFNPNMGYNSSAPMAFLMSIFNVRLGWWLGNPAHAETDGLPAGKWRRRLRRLRCKPGGASWRIKDPTCPTRQLLLEAAGQTSDDGPWIHLSDGGHFDNLGLWEMVYRRCRRILVIDASQDRTFAMDDFFSTVRKIRIDMGIEIDDDAQPIQLYPRSARASGLYCARFKIRYVDGGTTLDGEIIYVKPCFYGTEPLDVLEYAERSPAFPHESTADQFFNESQFESYRKLGEHEMKEVLKHPDFSPLFLLKKKPDGPADST